MTVLEDPTVTGTGTGSASLGWPARLRRHRTAAAIGLLVVLGAVVLTMFTGTSAENTTPLDPDYAGPGGARAVAEVLRQHGVRVDVVRSEADLLASGVDADTTVLVTSTTNLSRTTAAHLGRHARGASSIVLLDPGQDVTEGLGLPVDVRAGPVWDAVPAGCDEPSLGRDLEISGGDRVYLPRHYFPPTVTTCFADLGGGIMASVDASASHPRVVLLGSPETLANGSILRADNAAIALRLAGRTDRVLWYVASDLDVPVTDPTSLDTLLPRWLTPGLVLGASAVLALMLWRGRRLGRLVVEPLPAVVSATETTRSRSRMYRRAGDRTRAAAVLQAGTRTRLTAYLGLPRGTAPATLAAAVAAVTGRRIDEVGAALTRPPVDDSSLIALGQLLATLEKEVRRP
ncbi:DUF4350 domain-containing protein [Oryzihumus sp.]|uniref:DUF4350 domain-containing protein n=1 Tax=Oryzihumus sp. TaxID=1968903 RepID=UPI002EDAE733